MTIDQLPIFSAFLKSSKQSCGIKSVYTFTTITYYVKINTVLGKMPMDSLLFCTDFIRGKTDINNFVTATVLDISEIFWFYRLRNFGYQFCLLRTKKKFIYETPAICYSTRLHLRRTNASEEYHKKQYMARSYLISALFIWQQELRTKLIVHNKLTIRKH